MAPAEQPAGQHRLVLGDQGVQTATEQPHYLALRNCQSHSGQQRRQSLAGYLTLEMTGRDKAPNLRTKSARDARRKFRDNPLTT